MQFAKGLIVAAAVFGTWPAVSAAVPTVFSAGGDTTPASIAATRDAFRVALGGGTVAGANGSFGGLRREINWDGVPDLRSAPNNLPANFFNVNSPRGAVFATPGTGFQVSANSGVAAVEFGNIDASYAQTFGVFSAQRLFTALGSNIVDVSFFLPGTTTPGLVAGFGSIFSDVDLADTTMIEYFAESGVSLGSYAAPASSVADAGLSFLGVLFDSPLVARVRITNGNAALGAGVLDGPGTDLVVMDDFLFAEAQPVPEPAVPLLMFGGVLLAAVARRRRG